MTSNRPPISRDLFRERMGVETIYPGQTLRREMISGIRVELYAQSSSILPLSEYTVSVWDDWNLMFVSDTMTLAEADVVFEAKLAEVPVIIAKRAFGLEPKAETSIAGAHTHNVQRQASKALSHAVSYGMGMLTIKTP